MAKPFICSSTNPYYILSRTQGQHDWFVPIESAWRIFNRQLDIIQFAFRAEVRCVVVMNGTLEFTALFPEGNFSQAMAYFLRGCSDAMAKESGRINQMFGTRVKRVELTRPIDYANTYKYIYHRPVKVGLVESVSDYPYSSLQFLLGQSNDTCAIKGDEFFCDNPIATLGWLNRPVSNADWEIVRRGLRKRIFKLPRDSSHHGPHELNTEYL